MSKRHYDATLARIAGNLASTVPEDWVPGVGKRREWLVKEAVATAREIVAEVQRTEPADPSA